MAVIGFASNSYGLPKGHSYITRDLLKICNDAGHTTHMLRTGTNPIPEEFILPDTLENYVGVIIDKTTFENWLDRVKPEYVFFNEYGQWWDEDHDKVDICKKRGIRTIGYLVHEKLNWSKKEHYKKYWKIIAPTGYQTHMMRQHGLYNVIHLRWGVFMDEINSVSVPKRNDNKVIFYHCAGSGGVGDRKNTNAVIDAYNKIADENTELRITHLASKVFTRNEILAFTKGSDVLLNPSRWDTIGINTIEANACGVPVIVVDAPPMNELVVNNGTGFTVLAEERTEPAVSCPAYDVSISKLANAMDICKNKIILETLKKNAKIFAETNFDWEKNKETLLKLLEGDKLC